jgi:flagellar motor switch protein FliN/FliY
LTGAACEAALQPGKIDFESVPEDAKEVLWAARLGETSSLHVSFAASLQESQALGAYVLKCAGIEEQDPATLKSTFFEVISQAVSGWTRNLTGMTGQTVEVQESGESSSFNASLSYFQFRLQADGNTFSLYFGFNTGFFEGAGLPAAAVEIQPALPQSKSSGPYDLLLDVELPVSISFGRALVPLKEILKLNSGSIVELDRAVTEPVEVIVNNCVIARGEVVVVEGNYGIRIQQIISRHDRLMSMK